MKYADANTKLVGTTNPAMEQFLGKTGHLMAYIPWVTKGVKEEIVEGDSAYFDMLTVYMYTSTIKSIEHKDNLVILHTRNSIYTFEKLINNN